MSIPRAIDPQATISANHSHLPLPLQLIRMQSSTHRHGDPLPICWPLTPSIIHFGNQSKCVLIPVLLQFT